MKKILIVTKNWLGDILFEVPAIEMIRKSYPAAEILCLIHSRCRAMLEHHPAIDRFIEFDERSTHRSLGAKIQFVRMLQQEKIETAYFFHRSRTRAFLIKCAGISKRIGYRAKWPHFLTHPVDNPERPMHHVDYFVHLLTEAGFSAPENPSYRFYHAAKDRLSIERYLGGEGLRDFVCFHLGANWEPKRWPAGHFARLADLIHEKWKLPLILTGVPGDQELGEQVMAEAKSARVISFIGKTTLGELGALYSRTLFVVSGDSGPLHIAAGVGARVLALFGPTHPQLTGPRGQGETVVLNYVPDGYTSPWYGKEFPAEGWLSRISPDEVMEKLEENKWNLNDQCRNPNDEINPNSQTSKRLFGHWNLELPSSLGVRHSSRHILLITLSNIGDVILATPVLMSLVTRFPHHKITVVAGPRAKGILEGSRFIDRLVIYDKQAGLQEKIHFLQELRRHPYDLVVDLKNSALPFLVSAKKRSPVFRRFRKKVARERHLEILESMGLAVETIPPFDFFNEEEEASVFLKLRHQGIPVEREWIAVAPMAASELKTWPLGHYRQLIQDLVRETSYTMLLLGGERESRMLAVLAAVAPDRVFNTAGFTTLRESAVLIERSRLLIANDSSAGHFGFEMNRPSVIIFGPTNPEKVARKGDAFRVLQEPVFCAPCEKSFCRFERRACLEDLKPEKVLTACLELISSRGGALRQAPLHLNP